MTKFTVLWNDTEDDRSGESFEVEGRNVREAFKKALEHISCISPYYRTHSAEIDALVDGNGRHYMPYDDLSEEPHVLRQILHPDEESHPLATSLEINDEVVIARNNLLDVLRSIYPVVSLVEYDPNNLKAVLGMPASVISNLYDDNGSNAHFVDQEICSFFYDLSDVSFKDPKAVSKHILESFHCKERSNRNTLESVIARLDALGKKVTHITISQERYGGDDSSVWRDYDKGTLYEIVDFHDLLANQRKENKTE